MANLRGNRLRQAQPERIFGARAARPFKQAKQVLIVFLLCLAAMTPARALQLTDDRGVTVTFAQSPQRIVCMTDKQYSLANTFLTPGRNLFTT